VSQRRALSLSVFSVFGSAHEPLAQGMHPTAAKGAAAEEAAATPIAVVLNWKAK